MPAVPVSTSSPPVAESDSRTWADRLGMPGALRWGFVGLLIFMIGDGVESGYLSSFLLDQGVSQGQRRPDLHGVRGRRGRGGLGFGRAVGPVGTASGDGGRPGDLGRAAGRVPGRRAAEHELLAAAGDSYGLRGIGYPLFAYGFLVWIAAATPRNRLGSAVGWFWFAFTGGLPTLGSFLASLTIPRIGQLSTLWIALGLVVAGGLLALLAVRERTGFTRLAPQGQQPLATLTSSLTIMWRQPKIGMGAIVRAINTASQFGFLVFLPTFFTREIGFTLSQWLQLLTVVFLTNIFFNLLFGIIGDKVGWRQTVAFFGGIGCAITTLAFYYVPLAVGPNLLVAMLVGAAYGATLAAFVPLSALMPSLAPENKGAAMSALNFGAGMSAFLGPLVVTLFLAPLGVAGVMWIFAGLYIVSAILAWQLKLPRDVEATAVADRATAGHPISSLAGMAGGSLLGHPPAVQVPREDDDVDLILFDVGGTIYDDNTYARALRQAVHEIDPAVTDELFWAAYDEQRARGSGSLRTALANRFAGGDRARLSETANRYWEYPPDALYADVRPTLTALAAHYRLGVVANSRENVLAAMARDGIADLFSVVALASQVGVEKPDPDIFRHALNQAEVPAARAVYVGNRLDTDIRPARGIGMRTVWMLRGEAPPAPTADQLDEPDAVVTTLTGLPAVLARLAGTSLTLTPVGR